MIFIDDITLIIDVVLMVPGINVLPSFYIEKIPNSVIYLKK